MSVFPQFFFSLISTLGFAVLFNAPRRAVFWAGLTGALGWTVYWLMNQGGSSLALSTFIGALTVGLGGEILARIQKMPVTTYVIPGIVPLVPGYSLYLTMIHLLGNRLPDSLQAGMDVALTGGAISIAVILMPSLARLFTRPS